MLIHDEWLDSKGDFCGLFHPQLVHLGAEIIRPSAQRLMGSTKDASLGDSTQGQFPLRRCSHCWSYGSAFLCGALKVGDVRTMAEFVQLKEEEQKTKIDLYFFGGKNTTSVLNSWWKMFELRRKQRLLAKNTEVPLVFLGSYFGFRREAPGFAPKSALDLQVLRCDAEIDG